MSDSSLTPVRRALISVSDKTGLADLAAALAAAGVEILSTGGTARALAEAGVDVVEVADYTGFPEIMAGRVKTLHPRIHGGILARRHADADAMATHDIPPIDLVVANLYPFARTIERADVTPAEAVEQIDIGGPAMVRAAAKNHAEVGVVTDPADYREVSEAVAGGGLAITLRRRLARKAFAHTSAYDRAIADWLALQDGAQRPAELPERLELALPRQRALRYGENPHQRAAFYGAGDGATDTVAGAAVEQGKPLSFNNIADADTALECVKQFTEPACVIVKHANPCGVATAAEPTTAYQAAHATDPVSAFGGVIAFNRAVDGELARSVLDRQFVEVLIAPGFGDDARAVLAGKPNVRILVTGELAAVAAGLDYRGVAGGLLVQERDTGLIGDDGLVTACGEVADARLERDLLFAWQVAKFVKSNAIVLAAAGRTIGIGAGQMSRVIAARIAAIKAADAGLDTHGAVMASDAFIPFRDVLDVAAAAGVSAVIQPGGSISDDDMVAAAGELGLTMVFTGMRHFRH